MNAPKATFRDAEVQDPREEYLALLAEKQRRERFKRFYTYKAYEKQRTFLHWKCRIKALFGGNRVGKTLTAAYELVCHLTGLYPEDWAGRRFHHAIQAWTISVTAESAREIIQAMLLGDLKASYGTGMIPKDLIIDYSMRAGVSDTVDTIWVRHHSGDISFVKLKSNEQGREKMQGTSIDVVWVDEECDFEVFNECKIRTMDCNGIMLVTFTPLKGLTALAKWLLTEEDAEVVRHIVLGWDDVPHLTEKDKRDMSKGMLPHEIEARRTGLPTMATGLIYPFLAKDLLVRPFDLEYHWPGIIGLDVAYTAPTAGALLRYDQASRTTYLVAEHYLERQPTIVHVNAISRTFLNYPVRIDPASNRNERDGETIMKEYREAFGEGWEVKNANNAVYAGISRLFNAMSEGRFKVFSTCRHWTEEWSNYVWDAKKVNADGHPVPKKKDDHMQDATRYGFMDLEKARIVQSGRSYSHPLTTWAPLDPTTGY